jgi:hypothetical protein
MKDSRLTCMGPLVQYKQTGQRNLSFLQLKYVEGFPPRSN